MPAKRHHYVPQFYLRYFLPDGAKTLWVYDKEGGSARRQQPKDTAVIGGFYSVKSESGESDEIEREFSRSEAVAKVILDRWREDKAIPSTEEIFEIAYFLALLHTRVPRAAGIAQETGLAVLLAELEVLKENPEEARKSWEGFVADTGETRLSFDQFMEFLANPLANYKIEVNQKVAMGMSISMTKGIAQHLVEMNWCLCAAPDPHFFFTCDAPVNVFCLRGSKALLGAGFGLQNLEVAFPISPKICLLLDRTHMQKRRRVKASFVKEINRRTAFMAERYIFSPIDTKFVRQLVTEASVTRNRPKIDRNLLIRLCRSRSRET